MTTTLDEDDPLDACSDYTEEYERYLSNLESGYDICISIDFITLRVVQAQKTLINNPDNNDNDEGDNDNNIDDVIDSEHCYHLLTSVLPKSVEFLCKTDLNNLYHQDIISYQKSSNIQRATSSSSECREFLVSKIFKYFEYMIEFILLLKPSYHREFYDIIRDIFMLTQRIYKPHNGYKYRQSLLDECSGKYAECTQLTIKQYHPLYIKLINFFGDSQGFTIILEEMLDGKEKKDGDDNNMNDGDGEKKEDKPPSTLTHHGLQCYIISIACMHRFLLPQIKQTIAEYMYQAVEHWYMSMSISSIKQYPRSQIHAILKKLFFLLNNISNQTVRSSIVSKFEYLRLEIAYRWLCTDSLERKITAWKEFKEYIETTQRKYDIETNPHKYSNQTLCAYSYCKNPKSVAIFHINCRDVAQFLYNHRVLNLFLAEDVHEELLKKSFDILYFLGWYNLLNKKYIFMLWSHSIEKTESFINTVYKVIIDLFQSLSWELIEYILDLIINIPLNTYNTNIIHLISSFCQKCLYRISSSNDHNVIPQKIAEWHCGLKLLWRSMQNECKTQQLAMTKLVQCLQSDSGAVHQEYCKNLCVENLRCSKSVGVSLRVLQNIINAHPIISDHVFDDDENEKKHKENNNEESDFHQSTRSEIIHSLEKHHGILTLFFQDLSRYMTSDDMDDINRSTDNINNIQSRFDFLKFILQFSSLRLSTKQLDDLWMIVIGDTLNNDNHLKLEQNYFFKWLKDICPPFNAISIVDAVNLFHTKLGGMPRKTMTSDSLQCLHQYFDLVYELATKKSAASSAVTAHPDLSAALDVMWEIAIEAETDTVAQSCGVFILSFYMKPAVHQNHHHVENQKNIQNKVSDNILNLINSTVTPPNPPNNPPSTGNNNDNAENVDNENISKWEGRTNFVEKCMDYIQQQSISSNFRAVNRCLDLLETFIECTRPGVMRGEIESKKNTERGNNGFDDESSSDSVIYMGNNAGIKEIGLTPSDFAKTSPWDLGRYAIKYWKLPIGLNHFITINVSILNMQKDTKNFEIMINKYSRIGELKDLIAAILNQDKGLLQMQANNNVALQPNIESSTLESCNLRDGCSITVMSIFSLQNDRNNNLLIPDGAYILSQNRFYIEILLELLAKSNNLNNRLWNLLMRLPFNLQIVSSLADIVGLVQTDDNNNKIITNTVEWNLFIDASSTFKLLYSLQIFDSVMIKCNSSWLDSFILLNGLQHLYYTLINFQFDYTDNVFTYASYRSLYMLFKIFSSLTSHELIESDPLFTRSKPRHNTPNIIKIRSVNGTLSKFNHGELDVFKLGTKIFELIIEILHKNIDSNGNPLLAEIVDLALYQFIALLFYYSSRLTPLFDERYQQQSLQTDDEEMINWENLVISCLFCKDKLIRKSVVKHLYQIFVKYNPDATSSQNLHHKTLELLYGELANCKLNYSRHHICLEYFEFYGFVIKYYCKNVIYFDPTSYNQNLRYFETAPLQYTWDALRTYRGLETAYNDKTDEYLLGLLKLICWILIGFPTLKQHSMKLIRDLKNELIYQCLFAVPDPFEDPLGILTAPKRPPIPKCMTSPSRQAAFTLLLEISKNNPQIWNEILIDLQEIHDKRMNDIGDDIGFGFNPSYSRRSNTGLCGLNNYGCTCYMNATMQQLYCNPVVRKVILGVDLRKLYPKYSDDDNIPALKKTVFYAMQTMFSNLQWSDRRAVWPEDFLQNYRDFEGNKIDPNEQMDAHEFFNFLFDNLERELKGTIAEQILKHEFCGKEVNQVICQECGYVSETFVPMYAVSCKIQNHQTLEQSLEHEFVRGDWLKGGNAYRCSKCNKKVTALKRSCFTQLSNTMLVHLQRFEFNLETMLKVKINSELQFPTSLNMKKYTKEYLDSQENKTDDALMDDSDYEYELVGITVHSGMADIGHYYSFIRQQFENGTLGGWYSFNDDYVSNFDTNTMPDKCFGGNKLTLIRDSKTNQLVQRWIAKSNNAYILVYRRTNQIKKVENMLIEDTFLSLKDHKLNELKANNGRPVEQNIIEEEAAETVNETVQEAAIQSETQKQDQLITPQGAKESATEASSSPQIMELETSKPGEDGISNNITSTTKGESKPIVEEPVDNTNDPKPSNVTDENEAVRDPDLMPPIQDNDDANSNVADDNDNDNNGAIIVEPDTENDETPSTPKNKIAINDIDTPPPIDRSGNNDI